MESYKFSITEEQLQDLLNLYPNIGKNSDIGKIAVEIAKMFLLKQNKNISFFNQRGIDLSTNYNGITENFEIKGTTDVDISWNKLRVSSQFCYDNLVNGMNLLRVSNIGNINMTIHYLKHNEDFELVPEPRWIVRKKRI